MTLCSYPKFFFFRDLKKSEFAFFLPPTSIFSDRLCFLDSLIFFALFPSIQKLLHFSTPCLHNLARSPHLRKLTIPLIPKFVRGCGLIYPFQSRFLRTMCPSERKVS